jgi:integrase/recombinase XerC
MELMMENLIVKEFEEYLLENDKAALTVKGYLSDLRCFVRWFEQTNGEAFTLQAVTSTDVREYRQFLLVVETPIRPTRSTVGWPPWLP